MPSIINASTTLGLISTADTSGVLQLQTANTTALTIDGSQNVGVGIASPAYKLDVQTAAGRFQVRDLGGSSLKLMNSTTGGNIGIDSAGGITLIYANGTETARFDASGNVGIGTTSPSNRVSIVTASGSDGIVSVKSPTTETAGVLIDGGSTSNKGALLTLAKDATTKWRIGLDSAIGGGTNNNLNILGSSTDALLFGTNATERARIDSSGKLLVATTTVIDSARMTIKGSATVINAQTETDGSYVLRVTNAAGSGVGGVVANSSSTSYLTSSDYRLKNSVAPMTGALAKVALLKPVTYKWNADGSDGEGFIAHELAEVCPDAVSGEKDAVDAEGNPQYQGIDTSFLVATLTAAIQEQQAIIESLKARLDAANL